MKNSRMQWIGILGSVRVRDAAGEKVGELHEFDLLAPNELDGPDDRPIEVVLTVRQDLLELLRLLPAPGVLDVEDDAVVVGSIEPVANELEVHLVVEVVVRLPVVLMWRVLSGTTTARNASSFASMKKSMTAL